MADKKGIDVSQWQGADIDFAKVKAAGIDFVIIRAGYGKYAKQKDPQFETHYKNATAAGLGVGAYWYSYATSIDDAKLEAQACISAIKGKKFDYPIYFDLEESTQFAKGKTFCDSLVTTFCTALENAGYFAGLYISRSPLQQYISSDVASKYALWIAEYASKCNYSGTYGMWQYSSSGKINGISGNVDCDYCYEDYPKIIKNGGYNGYTKSVSSSDSTTAKTLDSKGYKKGDKSTGVLALKQLLILAKSKGIITQGVDNNSTFGSGTEKAVNALLKKWGYTENGIAGGGFVKKISLAIQKKIG